MALIHCNECGKEISSQAETCPHCGYRTTHGQTVAAVKGYAVNWVVAFIMVIVGVFMMLANVSEYMDKIDYMDKWKYFSDETQSSIQCFGIGVLLLIAGLVDMVIAAVKAKKATQTSVSYMESVPAEWECQRCYATNRSYDRTCVKCSMPRGGYRQTNTQNIPTWKRIQMEEEKQRQNQNAENHEN